LAVKIAEGYKKYKIVNNEHTKSRILLIELVRRILKISFHLVGIEPLEKI
jgi:arginyl-tRNA synthetase